MAQTSPDYDQVQEDPSQTSSLFSKLKDKTKVQGKKLKSKFQSNNDTDVTNDGGNEEDEEEDVPVHNAVSAGQTQPLAGDVQSYDPAATAGPTPGDEATAQPNEDEGGLTKSFQRLSTNEQSAPEETTPGPESTNEGEPTVTEKASDSLTSAKDETKGTLLGGDNPEQQNIPSDSPPVTEQAGQKAQQLGDKASETGKTWGQWAAQKVGYAKDTVNTNAPKTAEGKPYHQHAYDSIVGAKNQLAAHTDPNNMPSDPAQHTYVQKAATGIYGAKDSLFSATEPQDHDKALSQKVTDTVGSLPGTLKSSLGFGGKPGSSPTSPASVSSPTEEASGAPPQSPTLVGRITGLFGAKKPATGDSAPSSELATSDTGAEPTEPTSTS